MNNLKETLSQIITSKPDTLQFAKDRKFEESWIINLKQERPSQETIDKYLLKDKFETLIVEYVWESENDEKRFVLTIFLDKKCQLKNSKEFIATCLDNFYQYTNFKNLVDVFDKEVVGHQYFFLDPADAVNLSVFNHWLSVGPVDIWNQAEAYNKESVINKIKSRPDIERTKLNYQGLFFRFNVRGNLNGPYFGIKTPCCNKIGDEWVINFGTVDYWMKMIMEEKYLP